MFICASLDKKYVVRGQYSPYTKEISKNESQIQVPANIVISWQRKKLNELIVIFKLDAHDIICLTEVLAKKTL